MTLVVQPNVATPDLAAGVQTGELYEITADGARSLHAFPTGLLRRYSAVTAAVGTPKLHDPTHPLYTPLATTPPDEVDVVVIGAGHNGADLRRLPRRRRARGRACSRRRTSSAATPSPRS